jgi:cytochrome b561
MRLKDTPTGYGWVSVLLHWVTAVVIVIMLFVGNSIETLLGQDRIEAINLHTSIGISSYLFLVARIAWRFVYGHPGPQTGQEGAFYTIGKWVHYLILAALAAMLLTGPIMAWSSGIPIAVFDWFTIPAAAAPNFPLRDALHLVHRFCAFVIFMGIVLHLGGVYKHTAFNRDGTFMKMIIPDRQRSAQRPLP